MSTRVETRRSSKRAESVLEVNESTYGTRSAGKARVQGGVTDTPSPLMTRKRQREASSRRSSPVEQRRPSIAHEDKQFKSVKQVTTDAGIASATKQIRDEKILTENVSAHSTQTAQKRKVTPAMERMKVLEARFARLTKALLASQAIHIEAKIAEIKRGTCRELRDAYEPLEEQLETRMNIAEKKLALQKDEADRRWNAARTSAQYDFVNGRAELRCSLRHDLSRQIFDISREYREMSIEPAGITLCKGNLRQYSDPAAYLRTGPLGATVTETDEDCLLMDLPMCRHSETDGEALSVAPILGSLKHSVTTNERIVAPRGPVTSKRGLTKPQHSRRIEPARTADATTPISKVTSRSKASNLPSITSLISSNDIPADNPQPHLDPSSDYSLPVSYGHSHIGHLESRNPRPDVTHSRITSNGHVNRVLEHGSISHGSYAEPAQQNTYQMYDAHHQDRNRMAPSSMEYTPWPPRQHQQQQNNHFHGNDNYGPPRAPYTPYLDHPRDMPFHQYGSASSMPPFPTHKPTQDSATTFKPYTSLNYRPLNPIDTAQPLSGEYQHRAGPPDQMGVVHSVLPLPRAQPPPPASLLHPFRRTAVPSSTHGPPGSKTLDHGTTATPFTRIPESGRNNNGR